MLKRDTKLALRNLNGLWSYLKPNTKLYTSCQNDNIWLSVAYGSVASGDLQVKSYIFQILQRFLQQVNNSWVTAKSSKFLFRLGSIVDLCHYRFSEMDHKICYFLGRLTTNSFQLQGGGALPPEPPAGVLPLDPAGGTAPRPPIIGSRSPSSLSRNEILRTPLRPLRCTPHRCRSPTQDWRSTLWLCAHSSTAVSVKSTAEILSRNCTLEYARCREFADYQTETETKSTSVDFFSC